MRHQLRAALLRVTIVMGALLSSPWSESGNIFSTTGFESLHSNGMSLDSEKADASAVEVNEPQLPTNESPMDHAYRKYLTSIFEMEMDDDRFKDFYGSKSEFIQSMEDMASKGQGTSWRKLFNASPSQVKAGLENGMYVHPFGQKPAWMSHRNQKTMEHRQGWKIHISAKPHSAQKIAQMVLPILADLKPKHLVGMKFSRFKISRTLPHLRRLNATQFFRGLESQPGKFLVIYPENAEHRIALAKAIDEMFCKAKSAGIFIDDDFIPIVGDAIVGESGWVYTRYGKFSGDFKEEFVDGTFGKNMEDERFYPWPDFMNTREEWRYAPAPFGVLDFQWVSQNGQIVTWTEGTYYGGVGKPQGGWSALQEGQDEDDD